MIKVKQLSVFSLKDYENQYEGKKIKIELATYGIFDSINIHWEYYAISMASIGGVYRPTGDLSKSSLSTSVLSSLDASNIRSYYRKFETQVESDNFLKEFKLKWETASNNTTQIVRDEKLEEILKP